MEEESVLCTVYGSKPAYICGRLNSEAKKMWGDKRGYEAEKIRNMGDNVFLWRITPTQ